MTTALGLMVQGALAQSTGSGSSTGSAEVKRIQKSHPHRPHATHASQHADRHRHDWRRHASRPSTIVVVPAVVPRPLYYAPAPVVVAPPAYAAPQALAGGQGYAPGTSPYLFFCPDSRRYYPDVRECPSGWLAVVPGVPGPPN